MKTIKYETSPGALAAYLATRPPIAANFDLYTFILYGSTQLQGSVTGGSPTLSGLSSTVGLLPGLLISGPGIVDGTTILTVGSSSVGMSANASASFSSKLFSFGSWVPLTFATSDIDITVPYTTGTVRYSSSLAFFDQEQNKSVGHWKVGLDVDSWQVAMIPAPGAMVGALPMLSALRAGVLDGALAYVDRAVFNASAGLPQAARTMTPIGVVNMFTGNVAEVKGGRTAASITINSPLELLRVLGPPDLYQSGCKWTLFSPGCTLNAAGFIQNGTIAANAVMGTNPISVTVPTPGGSGDYTLGQMVMMGGLNKGFRRSIRLWTPGSPSSFQLQSPFFYPLVNGEAFVVYPGCDKQMSTCNNFSNIINFRGEPFIPAPETAL